MFMNDFNYTSPVPQNTAAPLKHDIEGRFSRHGIPNKQSPLKKAFMENSILTLYITFLLSIDFILFSGSGNIELFRDSIFPIPEVSLILLGFLVFSSLIVYLVHFNNILKNCVASLVTFALVFVLYRQFSTIQQILSIGTTSVPVHTVIGLIFALICYCIFYYGNLFARFLFMVASGILFFHIYSSYIGQPNSPEFLETYRSDKQVTGQNKRFVYFMLPNLSSYAYLSKFNNPESARTQTVMQGFYQKNNFTVYPKAFTLEDSFLHNMTLSLNPDSKKLSTEHILKTRLLSEYWRFFNIRHELINLKDNSLYDYFRNKNYMISAYKSRDFDMCHTNHEISVDRCIEKINQPVNIYDIRLSILSKMNILLMEWLASMQIVNNMSSVFSFLTKFADLDNAPMVGIDYSNLYVVNSIKTFDILLQNIEEDKGQQAYFVFVDLPSNMYIYNEFCQIKPTDEWYDISSLPWIKNDLSQQRQLAYLQQTRCLYGELEYFMQQMRNKNLLDNTTIVIQGTSSVNNFKKEKEAMFNDEFIANRSVNMAVFDETLQKKPVDWRFCSTNQILLSLLHGKNECDKKLNLGVHEKIVSNLNNELGKLSLNISDNVSKNFETWFESWKVINKERLENKNQKLLIEKNEHFETTDDEKTENIKDADATETSTSTTDETDIINQPSEDNLSEKNENDKIEDDKTKLTEDVEKIGEKEEKIEEKDKSAENANETEEENDEIDFGL